MLCLNWNQLSMLHNNVKIVGILPIRSDIQLPICRDWKDRVISFFWFDLEISEEEKNPKRNEQTCSLQPSDSVYLWEHWCDSQPGVIGWCQTRLQYQGGSGRFLSRFSEQARTTHRMTERQKDRRTQDRLSRIWRRAGNSQNQIINFPHNNSRHSQQFTFHYVQS